MPLAALSFAQSSVHCSRKLPQAGKGLFPQIDVVSVSLTLVTTSHWGTLWGHLWVIRNTKSTGSMKDIWIPPLSSWHPKTAAPSYFPEICTNRAMVFYHKNPPGPKQMPDRHKTAKRKISFSSALRCTSMQTHHPYYLESCFHSHHHNAYLTRRNRSLKYWGKTSSTLSSSLLI